MNPSALTPPRIQRKVPTYFTALIVEGVRHLVHGQCQPGKDDQGRMTFKAECQRHLVYALSLGEDESTAVDCLGCFDRFTPEGVRRA